MGDRYVLMESVDENLNPTEMWWCVDTSLTSDHPQKIVSSHSQKEAAETTVAYQNSLTVVGGSF